MDGVINVLKPPGMTSHDVVNELRRKLKIKKIGHTGTLDPGAAGVLPICLGKATKISEYIMSDVKEYICEMTLGNATDTFDKYGNLVFEKSMDSSFLTLCDIHENLQKFIGEIEQAPPVYSAIKINGKRAYELARKGETISIPKRKVIIYDIEILSFNPPKLMLRVSCSKGTYIRSLCNDIGNSLGTYAYMSFLLRTRSGIFKIQDAVPLSIINLDNINNYVKKMQDVLDFPKVNIDNKLQKFVLNGNKVKLQNNVNINGIVKIFIEDDKFIGIGKIEKNTLSVEKLLV